MKFSDLKIETQLKTGFSILLFLVIVLGTVSYIQTEKIHQQTEIMFNHPITVRRSIGEITRNVMFMRMNIRDLLLIEDNITRHNILNELEVDRSNVEKEIEVLRKWYLGPKKDIENFSIEFAKWVSIRSESIRLLNLGKTEEAKKRHVPGGIAPEQALKVLGSLDKISIFAINKGNELYNNSKILKSTLNSQLIFLTSVILLFSLFISYTLLRNIRKPLNILTNAARRFKNGDLTARSSYELKNEFGNLSDSFNELADSIVFNNERLEILVEERTKALKVSEEKFRYVFEYASVGKSITLPTGEISINKAFCDLLGYNKEELQNKKWQDITHPDDIELTEKVLSMLLNGSKKSYRFTKRYVCKNGSYILGDVSSVLLFDSEHKPLFFITTVIDITERKKIEDDKSEILKKLNEAQEIALIGSWEWNLQTNGVWWSDETYLIFGVTPQNFIPGFEANSRFIHPDDRNEYNKSLEQSLKTGKNLDEVFRLITPDGDLKYINSKGKIIFDNIGNPVRFIGTVMDITKQKKMEDALRTSEAQLSNGMMIAKLGYWEYNVDDNMFIFNDRFYDIFRTDVKKVGGYKMSAEQYARKFVHPDDFSIVDTETRKAIETKDPAFTHQLQHRIIYSDGEVGYISVRFFIIKDSLGRTVKTYGVNQDITESKRNEEHFKSKMNELKQMNELMIDREIKMVELKKEINELLKSEGKEAKY